MTHRRESFPRFIANECLGGGGTKTLSLDEQTKAWTRCGVCGRTLYLRKNQSGLAAQEALLPRHGRKSDRPGTKW